MPVLEYLCWGAVVVGGVVYLLLGRTGCDPLPAAAHGAAGKMLQAVEEEKERGGKGKGTAAGAPRAPAPQHEMCVLFFDQSRMLLVEN